MRNPLFTRARFMYGGSLMSQLVSSREMMPPGTLRKKIQRQEKLAVIQPPSQGPMVGATTTARPYTANAIPRFSSENVSLRMACSLGCNPPPPAPCKILKITSTPKLGASPHKNELTVKIATHDM